MCKEGRIVDPFSKEERKRTNDALKYEIFFFALVCLFVLCREEAKEAKRIQKRKKKIKEPKPIVPENKTLSKVITFIQKDKLYDIEKIINKEGIEWLNCVNKKGDSPLIVAVSLGNEDISKYLLKIKVNKPFCVDCLNLKGIDLEVCNAMGQTALLCAVENQVESLVNQLILYGADINAIDDEYNTALHIAIEQELEDIVELLLKKGVDVNIKNVFGKYPINIAAEKGMLDIVQLLVENGANIDVKINN